VGDGEQPGREPGLAIEAARVLREPQKGLLQQILGHVAPPRHAHQVAVEAPAVGREHGVERRRVAAAQTIDPCPFVGIHGARTHHCAQRDTLDRARLRACLAVTRARLPRLPCRRSRCSE